MVAGLRLAVRGFERPAKLTATANLGGALVISKLWLNLYKCSSLFCVSQSQLAVMLTANRKLHL